MPPIFGKPSVVASLTTANAHEALAVFAVIEWRNVGNLVDGLLKNIVAPCFIIIDQKHKRAFVTTDGDVRADWLAEIPTDNFLVCSPEVPGRIAKWIVTSSANVPTFPEFFHQYNRRSINQVVNIFSDEGDALNTPGLVLVDQFTGAVSYIVPNDYDAVIDAIVDVPRSGFTVAIELNPPAPRLTFE